MKLIFAGTPTFAARCLEIIMQTQRHEVIAVFTQPDRPAGRGLKIKCAPIKAVAATYLIPCYQPSSLKEAVSIEMIEALHADVMVVAAFAQILPDTVLRAPKWGCLNIHPSLLPRWRGASPIQHAILAGDHETGSTIMLMEQGLDTGPILLQEKLTLTGEETTGALEEALSVQGARLLMKALDLMEKGKMTPQPQNNEQATYAHKITKQDVHIDWTSPAVTIERKIRAFNPDPGACSHWRHERIKVFAAQILDQPARKLEPGTLHAISPKGLDVATGDKMLRITALQCAGGKKISASDFYNARGRHMKVGEKFS